jgi:hypothetical protein
MLSAFLHGKLSREQENMEDLLTSAVFGTFKYLPTTNVLLKFLSKATSLSKDPPLCELPLDTRVEFQFWPWLDDPICAGCEPDVLLRITCADGKRYLIVIEAKYLSGKSLLKSEVSDHKFAQVEQTAPIKDQLAREWQQGKAVAERELAVPVVIYLTADASFPREEIEASEEELFKNTKSLGTIAWLSWRHIPSIIAQDQNPMAADLLALLRRLNLTFFEGFSAFDPGVFPRWSFALDFDWTCLSESTPISWTFNQ